MGLSRNHVVAARFARAAHTYERNADLQARVAERLAELLPALERPRVLEIGCGTGLMTRHLLERYQHGEFLITDLAPEMVAKCRDQFEHRNGRTVQFQTMDGEAPDCEGPFDLVVLSMTLQWFVDPCRALKNLAQLLGRGGQILYAVPGQGSLAEWRTVLESCDLPHGGIDMPDLPHIAHRENRVVSYGSGIAFLQTLKGIGATTPRPGYTPLSAGSLRIALQRFEEEHDAQATWRILYGKIST
ncbi:MAG: methyltransferase domain-containing protein [Hyphomicrobiaceae bacterium]|nr:methyltransferase domain-containing protein [Hyphomicrobiaceae bacterium]